MDISNYFRIVSKNGNVLHLEHKGFWSDRVIGRIGDIYSTELKNAVDELSANGPFIVLADLSKLDVLTQKGRNIITQGMAYAVQHKLYKSVEFVSSAVTALSIEEAAEHTGRKDFRITVRSLEEAEAIVKKLQKELEPELELA